MNYTKREQNVIVLAHITELTYNLRNILIEYLNSGEPDFSKYRDGLIKKLSAGVYNKVKDKYSSPDFRGEVFEGLERRGITAVTIFSDAYPEQLKNTAAPPHVLFCKGDISLLKTRCFAVVGSRRSQPKAIADCKRISGEIAEKFTLVSGIADGADTAALEGALTRGKVICVLAHGFDFDYPSTCAPLKSRIEKEGLIITEHIPTDSPKAYYFPVRNRIIAGLSEGVLVVSAAKKSGALITANYAVEYNRDVFAFPYSLGVVSGEGCNSLIKNGAYLTENILDIFSVYGLDFNTPQAKQMTDDENAVYKKIKELGEAFMPDIAAAIGKQPYQIIAVISSLEIKELIVRLGGNRFSISGN